MNNIRMILAFLLTVLPAAYTFSAERMDPVKGDALLKAMSEKLAHAQTFNFDTTEFRDGVNPFGKKVQVNATRQTLVRRPNGFWTKFSGDRDWEFWYDGKMLTGLSAQKKVYVQHDMPPTLDESMDMLAARLNMDLPMSDILYSSPYEAFMDSQTQGGYTGSEEIDGASCAHLVYKSPAVDWELWINEKSNLPCKLQMLYKKDAGHSFYRITFSNWNFSPEIKADAFAFKVPADYVRIAMLERVVLKRSNPPQTQSAPAKP